MTRLTVGVNDLETVHPGIATEWDVEKNGGSLPSQYTCGSSFKAWWTCAAHAHSWQDSISHRANSGRGCPYCSNKKVLQGFNDLSSRFPEIAAEWNYDKNEDLIPTDVVFGSNKRVWWKCSTCGFVWATSISNRTANGTGCPQCASARTGVARAKPLDGESLADRHPELVAQWSDRNGNLSPYDVKSGSNKKVWWKCENGHEWSASIYSRSSGRGCPFCGNRRLLSGYNDLGTRYPDIARQWHPAKNGELTPRDVMPHSKLRVWWLGDCGHEWNALIRSRVASHSGCPVCDEHRRMSFPEKAVYYYVSKAFADAQENCTTSLKGMGRMTFDVWIPSIRTVVEYDGEAFHTSIERDVHKDSVCHRNGVRIVRIRESGCPEYEGHEVEIIHRANPRNAATLDECIYRLSDMLGFTADIDTSRDAADIQLLMHLARKENSVESRFPTVASEWNYELNEGLSPWMFSPGSKHRAWWNCPNGHTYETSIGSRCVSGTGCPYCRGEHISKSKRKPKDGASLADKNPTVASEWHPEKNGDLTPFDVYNGSRTKVWWKCQTCGHEWATPVRDRGVSGCGCPECAKKRIALSKRTPPIEKSLAVRFPDIATQWCAERNGPLTPFDVYASSGIRYWWKCPRCGHEWLATPHNRTYNGSGCPECYKSSRSKCL